MYKFETRLKIDIIDKLNSNWKKSSCRAWIKFQIKSIFIESSHAQINLIRLYSFLTQVLMTEVNTLFWESICWPTIVQMIIEKLCKSTFNGAITTKVFCGPYQSHIILKQHTYFLVQWCNFKELVLGPKTLH
jgi:hypothetical protein